ncbi:MAG: ferrous iron transport protein A [Clostridia bacterium]|nr:ferrous iron transport protein A [Clostridia bacterium]
MKKISMNNLPEGTSGKIVEIYNQKEFTRLADFGVISGSVIKCVKRNKGIGAYLIKGCVIALRNEDSEKITVETGVNYE